MDKGIYIDYEEWSDYCIHMNKMIFDMGIRREDNTQTPKFLLMKWLYDDGDGKTKRRNNDRF